MLLKTQTLSQISQEIEDQSAKDLLRHAACCLRALYRHADYRPGAAGSAVALCSAANRAGRQQPPGKPGGERIDVAIRITDNPEPGMIARRLGECRSVLCASPEYLARHGIPEQLEDLARHNCLHYSFFAGQSWNFITAEGNAVSTAVKGI